MEIKINIEKKHLYIFTALCILVVSMVIASSSGPDFYHTLAEIYDEEDGNSIDADQNGLVDAMIVEDYLGVNGEARIGSAGSPGTLVLDGDPAYMVQNAGGAGLAIGYLDADDNFQSLLLIDSGAIKTDKVRADQYCEKDGTDCIRTNFTTGPTEVGMIDNVDVQGSLASANNQCRSAFENPNCHVTAYKDNPYGEDQFYCMCW